MKEKKIRWINIVFKIITNKYFRSAFADLIRYGISNYDRKRGWGAGFVFVCDYKYRKQIFKRK